MTDSHPREAHEAYQVNPNTVQRTAGRASAATETTGAGSAAGPGARGHFAQSSADRCGLKGQRVAVFAGLAAAGIKHSRHLSGTINERRPFTGCNGGLPLASAASERRPAPEPALRMLTHATREEHVRPQSLASLQELDDARSRRRIREPVLTLV